MCLLPCAEAVQKRLARNIEIHTYLLLQLLFNPIKFKYAERKRFFDVILNSDPQMF
jgi:hypothetical protein